MFIIDENYRMSMKYLTAVILLCHPLVFEVVVASRPTGNICENGYSCDGKSNKCYSEKDRCNGKSTCFNNADEKNCTAEQCNSRHGLFLCTSGRCIYETWMCDKTDDCEDNSDELDCSGSTTRVIISAVVGSLICSLLLVVVLGCTCKQYLLSTRDTCRRTRHSTPLSRLQVEIMGRRPPPPSYNEAMLTSRPFEEVRREVLSRQSTAQGEVNSGYEPDAANDASTFDVTTRTNNVETENESCQRTIFESNSDSETSGCDNTNDLTDDDELLDLGEDSDVHIQMNEEEDDDDVNLLAVWHSNFSLPSSDDTSEDTQLLDLSNKTSKDCDKNKLTPPVTTSTSSPSSTSSASPSSTYAQLIPPPTAPPPLPSSYSTNDSPLPSNSFNTSSYVTSLQSRFSDTPQSVFSDSVPLLEDV